MFQENQHQYPQNSQIAMEEEKVPDNTLLQNLSSLKLQDNLKQNSMDIENKSIEPIRQSIESLHISEKKDPEEIIQALLTLKFYYLGPDLSEKIREIKDNYLRQMSKEDIVSYINKHAFIPEPSEEELKAKYRVFLSLPDEKLETLSEEDLIIALLGAAYFPWQYDNTNHLAEEPDQISSRQHSHELLTGCYYALHYGNGNAIIYASNQVSLTGFKKTNEEPESLKDVRRQVEKAIEHKMLAKKENPRNISIYFDVIPNSFAYTPIHVSAWGSEEKEKYLSNMLSIIENGYDLNGK